MRLLDLFCGAGGCAVGYHRAGFEVIGIDIKPQPDYPYEFIQWDAIHALEKLAGYGKLMNREFHAVHASPPCQAHTTMSNRWRGAGGLADERVSLIGDTRRLLEATGLLWVIENVPGARSEMRHPYVLNGGMFGLGVDRPRLFETNFPMLVPQKQAVADPVGVYGKAADGRRLFTRADGSEQRAASSLKEAQEAMGMPWVQSFRGIAEAVPPAYTEFIGHQLAAQVVLAA